MTEKKVMNLTEHLTTFFLLNVRGPKVEVSIRNSKKTITFKMPSIILSNVRAFSSWGKVPFEKMFAIALKRGIHEIGKDIIKWHDDGWEFIESDAQENRLKGK